MLAAATGTPVLAALSLPTTDGGVRDERREGSLT